MKHTYKTIQSSLVLYVVIRHSGKKIKMCDASVSFSLNTIEYCWSLLYESFIFFMIVMQYILNIMFVILIILKNIHIIFLLARFCCVVALNGQVSRAHEYA